MKRLASIALALVASVLTAFAQDITIPDITTAVPGEVKNEFGIIMTPGDGNTKTYQRGGKRFEIISEISSTVAAGYAQDGVLYTVECDNDVVYMQRPVMKYGAGKGYASVAWIRGERQGDNLVFPAGQPVNLIRTYDDNWDIIELMATVCLDNEINGGSWFEANTELPIVFHEETDGTLTLTTEPDHDLLGIFYSDGTWAGYGDYKSSHTFYGEGRLYIGAKPSWRLKQENFVFTGLDVAEGQKNYNVRMAFDEATGEVFLGNFCAWTQYKYDADDEIIWIKGNKNADGSLTFPMEQYLFEYNSPDGDDPLYFYGVETKGSGIYTVRDLTFRPDGAEGHYKADYGLAVIKGVVSTSMNRYEVITDLSLQPAQGDGERPFIITEQPDGDLFTYTRSGVAFGFDDQSAPGMCPQSGTIEIVLSKDRKYVYLHNPIAEMAVDGADSWVSGTVITYQGRPTFYIPMQQYIDWSDKYGYGQKLAAFRTRAAEPGMPPYEMVLNLVAMTYAIDVETGVITLDRLDGIEYDDYDAGNALPPIIIGSAYSDDNGWTYYGDFDSVYTPAFIWNAEEFFTTGIQSVGYDPAPGTYYDLSGRRSGEARTSGVPSIRIEGGRAVLR